MTEHYTQGRKKLPKILSKAQLLTILRKVPNAQLAMAVFLGVFLGLRISEFARDKYKGKVPLKWEDVDLEIGEVTILDAKNPRRYRSGYGKDRIVPIFDEFIHIFKMWQNLNPHSKYLLSQKGRREAVSLDEVQRDLKKVLQETGLLQVDYYQTNGIPRYKYHFHTFRHVCGTNLLRRGLTLEQVKEFLGHENIESTMIYVNLVKDDLKEALTVAYAYPKQRKYFLPLNEVPQDVERLQLENENLRMKLQLQQVMVPEIQQ